MVTMTDTSPLVRERSWGTAVERAEKRPLTNSFRFWPNWERSSCSRWSQAMSSLSHTWAWLR